MKLFIALLLVGLVIAVPVTQVPDAKDAAKTEVKETKTETKVEEKTPAKTEVADTKVDEKAVKTDEKAVKTDEKVEEKKEEKVEEKKEAKKDEKAEEKKEEKKDDKVEAKAEIKKDVKAVSESEKVKEQALNQVMSFITDMAQPLNDEEHKALKDIMDAGSDILIQAEKKAKEVEQKLGEQNLLQSDSLFGIKEDGSIDADAAANQVTTLLGVLSGNSMSSDEKNVIHDIIAGFAKAFAPSEKDGFQADLEKLADQFTKKIDGVTSQVKEGKHDDLLNPQTLMTLFTENSEDGIDTKLLSDLTDKFMNKMEKQFQFASEKLKTLEKPRQ